MTNAKALEIFTAQTMCDVGILLSVISCLLHLGRPYFDRVRSRLPLRVASDLWWLAYLVFRDGSLFAALVLGLWHLNLDLMADIKVGLPFVPFATVALAAALLLKVFRGEPASSRASVWSARLVFTGALLNTLGYVLVMEAPGDEYAAAKTAFWQTLTSWRSNENPAMATWVFYASWSALVVVSVPALWRAMRSLEAPKSQPSDGSAETEKRDVAA